MAKMKIYLDAQDQVWKVRRIDDSHNHPLAATMFNHLLPSHRSLSESNKAQVDSLKKFGIATLKIMAYMAGQSGATISYLEGKANADIMSVARYTKPLEGRLGSLFWADGQMMADYKLFGDVVAFDATYRSNKYKKPLVVFSGSNHNKQTAIFVVTDGDKAMRAAIDDVLPSARHRLCGWHLEKNCVMQVKEPDFRKVFKKEMYANLDVLTTSRCEGINAFVKGFLKSTNSLLELVHSLDRVVKVIAITRLQPSSIRRITRPC
ncbi:hypothetical protein Ahy_B07g087357 isoform B [Arachis hypogaea]|uniref:MULE transposase domain-containing protein n=1 Tax=Arachis hypogaea TaxID=3818 RepID=A0A444YBV8_ARAHY|nr:hypothetical protein Ahy_B07g087357 isoform B [Arachis hypogaea]